MYITAYPIAIAIRNSNVYEERSIGVYAPEEDEDYDSDGDEANNPDQIRPLGRAISQNSGNSRFSRRQSVVEAEIRKMKSKSGRYFLRHQIRAQLSHDLWWLAVAVFVITVTETGQFEQDPVNFSVFNIVFECKFFACCLLPLEYSNKASEQAFPLMELLVSRWVIQMLIIPSPELGIPY